MIIHQPEIKQEGGTVRISTRVEMQRASDILPKTLWFEFPDQFSNYISPRADGFLACLVLVASYFKEDLDVRGTVSPKIANNIDDFILPYQKKFPGVYSPINIAYQSLEPSAPFPTPTGAATAFSGGIDSFYTLWSHFNKQESPNPVSLTHGLFIRGLEIFEWEHSHYQRLSAEYGSIFKKMGLELITAASNFYQYYKLMQNWEFAHTPNLAGTALILGNKLKIFYKPGAHEVANGKERYPGYLVNLLSTETLDLILHSPELGRKQKLAYIKDWEPPHTQLRVCSNHIPSQAFVCYRCEKCLNTILEMEIQDIRSKFTAYTQSFPLARFLTLPWHAPGLTPYRESLTYLFRQKKRYDLILGYWLLLIPHAIKIVLQDHLFQLLPNKVRYFIKRLVFSARV